jgi:Na+-driven multidrug efflux pump
LQVFQFVGVTITNKLASNDPNAQGLTEQQRRDRAEENGSLVSYSVSFAAVAGISTTVILTGFGPQILGLMGTNVEMLGPALAYLNWRALAAPAVLLMNVCQGICLGQQNSITPLVVFACVGLANVVLDWWLIMGRGMGCTGAAIATAAAQWAGALYFFQHLRKKVRLMID